MRFPCRQETIRSPCRRTARPRCVSPIKTPIIWSEQRNRPCQRLGRCSVTFTVPEDSKLVFFYFGGEQGATLNEAAYTGAKDGSVKLGYKLLPLSSRTVFRTSPQTATSYSAAFTVRTLSSSGRPRRSSAAVSAALKTVSFRCRITITRLNTPITTMLSRCATSVFSVWRPSLRCSAPRSGCSSRAARRSPLIVMLLGACVLQMFGQAVSDVTWSVGCCVPTFFAVLALVTLHCGDSLRLNVPNKSKAARSAGRSRRFPLSLSCSSASI